MNQILAVKHLSVELHNKTILRDINLSLESGEILGLVGPSGCGKTTLLNTIAGFIELSEGEMVIDAHVVSKANVIPAEKRHVGVIFQDYALFPHQTVKQNISFGINRLPKPEQNERIEQLLSLLKLNDFAERYPHQLSGGQQQRVAIARALAVRPKILLLDEPFSNIDARLRNELMLELRMLLKSLKMSAVFVTHNKDEVFTFADKISLLHQGTVLQTGTPRNVFDTPINWQVADFLQIGCWLPVSFEEQFGSSLLGDFTLGANLTKPDTRQCDLLVKPHYLELVDGIPNCVVDYISFTEQGYHYTLSSLEKDHELSFERLSFYSQELLELEQKIKIHLIAHDYQLFSR